MNEKFPYGYDLNAYIDKAFEQMKADFPWATRDMIAEHTCLGIEKVGDDYQYNVDCEEFIRRLTKDHDWELEKANATLALKSSWASQNSYVYDEI